MRRKKKTEDGNETTCWMQQTAFCGWKTNGRNIIFGEGNESSSFDTLECIYLLIQFFKNKSRNCITNIKRLTLWNNIENANINLLFFDIKEDNVFPKGL